MNKYYLGLDAGGTKTHIALYNPALNLIDLYTGGGGNYENMPGGYAELSTTIQGWLDDFLPKHGITTADISRAGFGMSGVDSQIQHDEIHKVLSGLGFKDFDLGNDCVLGIKAVTTNGYGIACVCGTGYSVVGLDENGELLQLGGMGAVTGDIGGGHYTMCQTLAYVFGNLYKRYPDSALVAPVMARLGITHKSEFMNATHHHSWVADGKVFCRDIAKIAFKTAQEGDAAATNIMKISAISYGEAVVGALDNLTFANPPEIALTGSVFQKNPDSVLISLLSDYLKEHYKKPFQIKILDAPAVLGALVWAMGKISDEERKELGKKLYTLDGC